MPRATVSTEAERHDLKTCPDGYVVLRALSYGRMLDRREKAAQFVMEQNKGKNQPDNVIMNIMQRGTRLYEYQHCIVEHNLEDDNGALLNFRFPATLDQLDPKIGQEIEELIDAMHQSDEDLANFPPQSGNSSSSVSETQDDRQPVTTT